MTDHSSCGPGLRMLTGGGCGGRGREKPASAASLAVGVIFQVGTILVEAACDHLKAVATARLKELRPPSAPRPRAAAAACSLPQASESAPTKEIAR